jgi:dephospho-CoA kinase
MIIGLVGKVGSGKTTCAEFLKEKYNAIVFSCDEIAKDIIEKKEYDLNIGSLTDLLVNNNLQEEIRTKLHPLVFYRIFKNLLEQEKGNITNNYNSKNFIEFFDTNHIFKNFYVIESALPSDILYKMCDKTICVESGLNSKIDWLSKMRDYSEEKTNLILDSQKYYEKFYDMADYKIINDGDKEKLFKNLKEVVDEIHFVRK